MQFPLGTMSVGDILDRGLNMLLARLPAFFFINLAFMSPIILLAIFVPLYFLERDDATDQSLRMVAYLGFFFYAIAAAVLQPFASGAVLHMIMQQIEGKRARVLETFSFTFSKFGTMFGGSLLGGMIFGAGSLFCCVPGKILFSLFAFVPQAILLEKMSVGDAFQRSISLMNNYILRVFFVLLVISGADLLLLFSIVFGVREVLPIENDIPSANGQFVKINTLNYFIVMSMIICSDTLYRTYSAVCSTMIYLDLRIRKEGFDLELAARLDEEQNAARTKNLK